jgi:hypothetical protein
MKPEHIYTGASKTVEEMIKFVLSFPESDEYKELQKSQALIADAKYNFNLETIYKNFNSFITYMWREISPIVVGENYRDTKQNKVNKNFTTFKQQYIDLEQKINKFIQEKNQNSLILFRTIDFGNTGDRTTQAIKKIMKNFE